jgi:hypothetical protein
MPVQLFFLVVLLLFLNDVISSRKTNSATGDKIKLALNIRACRKKCRCIRKIRLKDNWIIATHHSIQIQQLHLTQTSSASYQKGR